MAGSKLNYQEIRLDRTNPMPLYLQLSGELKRLLNLVCLSSEERLLSERHLSERLGVNRVTVGKAYAELFKEGMIERPTPRTWRISKRSRRKLVEPYPSIGIILPTSFSELMDDGESIPFHYFKGVIDSAMEKNISTIMLQLPPLDAPASETTRFNKELMTRLLGVIHIGGRNVYPDRPLEALMKNDRLPQVIISAYPKLPNIGAVVADPVPGGRALAEQLRSMRHRKVGILVYTPGLNSEGPDRYFFYEAWSRARKMLEVFQEYGLDCDEKFQLFSCQSPYAIRKKLEEKIRQKELPTVFWCSADKMAVWAIEIFESVGVRVPEDISVVGFNGLDVMSGENRLTSICLPFYEIGRRAVDMILNYYENGISDANRMAMVQTFLTMRKSLGYAKN